MRNLRVLLGVGVAFVAELVRWQGIGDCLMNSPADRSLLLS